MKLKVNNNLIILTVFTILVWVIVKVCYLVVDICAMNLGGM
jgi:hypothetical protein